MKNKDSKNFEDEAKKEVSKPEGIGMSAVGKIAAGLIVLSTLYFGGAGEYLKEKNSEVIGKKTTRIQLQQVPQEWDVTPVYSYYLVDDNNARPSQYDRFVLSDEGIWMRYNFETLYGKELKGHTPVHQSIWPINAAIDKNTGKGFANFRGYITEGATREQILNNDEALLEKLSERLKRYIAILEDNETFGLKNRMEIAKEGLTR